MQPPNLAVLTYLHISRCKKRFRTPNQLQSLHINSLKADVNYVQKIGLFYCIFITLQHVKVGVVYTATWYLQELTTMVSMKTMHTKINYQHNNNIIMRSARDTGRESRHVTSAVHPGRPCEECALCIKKNLSKTCIPIPILERSFTAAATPSRWAFSQCKARN